MFSVTSATGYRTQKENGKTHRFFPLLVSIHHCSRLVIYTLFLSERKKAEAWEPSKKQCSFGYRGELNRKVLSILENPLQLRWVVAGETGSEPWAVNVGSVVDKVAVGQVLLWLLRFSHVSIMTLVLYTCPHLQNYSYQTEKRSKPVDRLTKVTFYCNLGHSQTPPPTGCLYILGKFKVLGSPATLTRICQSTWCHMPEDSNLLIGKKAK